MPSQIARTERGGAFLGNALVTGASRGIGRAIAIELAAAGYTVYGTSRDPRSVDWPEGIIPVALDLSDPDALQRDWELARLGDVAFSVLVNNAGAGVFGEFSEVDFSLWRAQIELLLISPMKLCHLVAAGWRGGRPGVIVNVSSLAVEYPIPFMSAYNAAKAGLSGFTESLLLELGLAGARVIDFRLGDYNTRFGDSMVREGKSRSLESVWQAMLKHVSAAPPPEHAARKLLGAIRMNKVGTIRAGGFFQSVVAPIFGRFIWSSVKRAVNLSYYNLRSRG